MSIKQSINMYCNILGSDSLRVILNIVLFGACPLCLYVWNSNDLRVIGFTHGGRALWELSLRNSCPTETKP